MPFEVFELDTPDEKQIGKKGLYLCFTMFPLKQAVYDGNKKGKMWPRYNFSSESPSTNTL